MRNAMIPVYIAERTPGATDTVAWEKICHSKEPFIWISHHTGRSVGAWGWVERKRQYCACYHSRGKRGYIGGTVIGYYSTIEKAIGAGKRWAAL